MSGVRKTALLSLGFVLIVLAGFVNKVLQGREPTLNADELRELGAFVLPTPRELSPFRLRDQDDQVFDLTALKGRWTLLYFGFTRCPDVCPTTLRDLARANPAVREALRAQGVAEPLQVVLVSVDPERDTPAHLREYVRFFDADFLAATGEHNVLAKLATEVNAGFAKVPVGSAPGDYLMDHTGNVVIVNPHGHYHGFLRPPLIAANFEKAVPAIAGAL